MPIATEKLSISCDADEVLGVTRCGTHPASHPDVINRLNSLLRGELAVVAGYQRVLRTLRRESVHDGEHVLGLASDHLRSVTALRGSVQARGGAPFVSDPWADSGAAPIAGDSPVRLENEAFVCALLEVERRGLAEYEAVLGSLDEDGRELVELELIPRQRRHVAGLSALLLHLAA